MNLVTVDVADFRSKLADYLALVNLGEVVVSVKNAKSGTEIARVVSPVAKTITVEKRIKELSLLAGFASSYSDSNRKRFTKMESDYIKNLKANSLK